MRIAIAGFQHETNTLAPLRAELHNFETAGVWPGLTHGDHIFTAFASMNIAISGFIDQARSSGHQLAPLLWCAAEPSAHITDIAFDTITGQLLEALASLNDIDAIYLDLHGAMVTETFDDGEGEILQRVRDAVGAEIPIVASLDLHVNLTAKMVALSDALTIYRTYPHLDMAQTGARCVALLERIVESGKPFKAHAHIPFLTPLQAQYTHMRPNERLYGMLDDYTDEQVWSADIGSGFPAADIFDAGPSIVAYATTAASAEAQAERLATAFSAAEDAFDSSLMQPADAVRRAMQQPPGKAIILADVEDNPGAGATSDTTGILKALVDAKALGAVVGLFFDAEIAGQAHAAGIGAEFNGTLGGKAGGPGDGQYVGQFRTIALSNGEFKCSGEMFGGSTAQLGPMALLQVIVPGADIRVVVSTQRFQCLDQAMFRHLGVDLDNTRIVVVKSTVHFRADFEPIAQAVWPVRASGANPCNLASIDYQQLRPGVRLGPNGPPHVSAKQ